VKKSDKRLNQPLYGFIRNSSYLTDILPSGGRLIDSFIYGIAGNKTLTDLTWKILFAKMQSIKNFGKILVVSDLNIGDAVLMQSVISGIRNYLPEARLDYIFTASAGELITGNPEISNAYPVLKGRPFPNINDFDELERIISSNKYDFILNICPLFIRKKNFVNVPAIDVYLALAPQILYYETRPESINHVAYQANIFIQKLLAHFIKPVGKGEFKGVSINVSDEKAMKAGEFFSTINLSRSENPVILYNPDASSRYTTIPLHYQISLIRQLAEQGFRILLACGYTLRNIEKDIMNSIPELLRSRIILLPYSASLTEIAAFVDLCDIYLGGDTGPLHIAAAKKISPSGNVMFRNKTAVFSIFGATPARVYGYDSDQPGHLPAHQSAASRVYAADSPCQNITCADKKNKICKVVRCFDNLNTRQIIKDILNYSDNRKDGYFTKSNP
jgi:ADP-heptose:LPS heptosyltransferase